MKTALTLLAASLSVLLLSSCTTEHIRTSGFTNEERSLYPEPHGPETFKVAAVQASSVFGDPAANRKHLASLVAQAAGAGASIVVLPEASVTGYLTDDLKKAWRVGDRAVSPGLIPIDPSAAAETVPGPSTEFFGKLAAKHHLYLTVPLIEVDHKTGRYYNTSVLLDPQGQIVLHYRKRNPWPWAECGWATDGDRGNPVVDTPYGRLGLLVCFDIHKQATIMGELKVDILLYSIAWVEDRGSDWFEMKLPEIAQREGFNIVAANWTVGPGAKPNWFGYGQSRVISAQGQVLGKADDDLKDDIVYAELPLPSARP